MTSETIGVVGLGYVGLPVALAFGRAFQGTVAFDISDERVVELRRGHDRTHEATTAELRESSLHFSTDANDLAQCSLIVVAVPTPIDRDKRPDLSALIRASEMIAAVMRRGTIVVYESTVYPGVTEEVCRPILARRSGLVPGIDFAVGYSPERINPGDREHTLERIIKVVSGEDAATTERVACAYRAIVPAGVHVAPSIRVAEAAKVIENTQRDLNIALMNELAVIFDRLGISTHEVLDAAATKWNFLSFTPGLVGGHCIGVDPYYLTAKAESVGYHPQVILAGRRINDGMGAFVAESTVKLLSAGRVVLRDMRVAILGLTFKENVPDLRNSRVPDVIATLREYGIEPLVHDPLASAADALHEHGVRLVEEHEITNVDALVVAVPHRVYVDHWADWCARLTPSGVLVDVKGAFRHRVPEGVVYWAL